MTREWTLENNYPARETKAFRVPGGLLFISRFCPIGSAASVSQQFVPCSDEEIEKWAAERNR